MRRPPKLAPLYPSHVPTSSVQRGMLAVGSAIMSIVDPTRGDMVATTGEVTAPRAILDNLRLRMQRDISGRELLARRPRITNETVDRAWISSLPEGSLGREYSRFLDGLSTSPDARPPVQFVDGNTELVYVMQRYRETHDFLHTLLQMRPNMLGEVTIKYFEAIQYGLPMCILAAITGGLRLGPKHREELLQRNLPWVVEQAQRSRFLLAMDWENRFEQPIAELQRECGIEPLLQETPTSWQIQEPAKSSAEFDV